MSAKAGEVARETSAYRCEQCHHKVEIRAGGLIPDCEKCGHSSFKTGWNIAFPPPKSGRVGKPSRALADALFDKS